MHRDDRPLQARLLDEYSQRVMNEEGPGRVKQKMEILTEGNLPLEE